MTNFDYIRSLTAEEIADKLIDIGVNEEWNMDYTGEPYIRRLTYYYETSDSQHFKNYDDALAHEISWLNDNHVPQESDMK